MENAFGTQFNGKTTKAIVELILETTKEECDLTTPEGMNSMLEELVKQGYLREHKVPLWRSILARYLQHLELYRVDGSFEADAHFRKKLSKVNASLQEAAVRGNKAKKDALQKEKKWLEKQLSTTNQAGTFKSNMLSALASGMAIATCLCIVGCEGVEGWKTHGGANRKKNGSHTTGLSGDAKEDDKDKYKLWDVVNNPEKGTPVDRFEGVAALLLMMKATSQKSNMLAKIRPGYVLVNASTSVSNSISAITTKGTYSFDGYQSNNYGRKLFAFVWLLANIVPNMPSYAELRGKLVGWGDAHKEAYKHHSTVSRDDDYKQLQVPELFPGIMDCNMEPDSKRPAIKKEEEKEIETSKI